MGFNSFISKYNFRSQGEYTLAVFLFENNIEFKYESSLKLTDEDLFN